MQWMKRLQYSGYNIDFEKTGTWIQREGWARCSRSWLRCLSLYWLSQLRHLSVPDEFGKILLRGYSKITARVDNSIFLPGKDKWHLHREADNYTLTFFFALLGNDNFQTEVSLKKNYVVSNASVKHSVILQQYLGRRPPHLHLIAVPNSMKQLLRTMWSPEIF